MMNTKLTYNVNKKDLLRKHQEQKQKVRQIQENALKEARELAHLLVEQFGIGKVLLIGPLTYDAFTEGMPLELALDEIPEGTYASAYAAVRNSSPYTVELIDIRQADSWTIRTIREKGLVLASL